MGYDRYDAVIRSAIKELDREHITIMDVSPEIRHRLLEIEISWAGMEFQDFMRSVMEWRNILMEEARKKVESGKVESEEGDRPNHQQLQFFKET